MSKSRNKNKTKRNSMKKGRALPAAPAPINPFPIMYSPEEYINLKASEYNKYMKAMIKKQVKKAAKKYFRKYMKNQGFNIVREILHSCDHQNRQETVAYVNNRTNEICNQYFTKFEAEVQRFINDQLGQMTNPSDQLNDYDMKYPGELKEDEKVGNSEQNETSAGKSK